MAAYVLFAIEDRYLGVDSTPVLHICELRSLCIIIASEGGKLAIFDRKLVHMGPFRAPFRPLLGAKNGTLCIILLAK